MAEMWRFFMSGLLLGRMEVWIARAVARSFSIDCKRRSFAKTISRATYPKENRRAANPRVPQIGGAERPNEPKTFVYRACMAKASVPTNKTPLLGVTMNL